VNSQDDLIFALDIGTRTVIGVLLDFQDDSYQVVDAEVIEHEKRAMLDGQIHNVREVAKQVARIKTRLEERNKVTLEKVAIAAAGRALKTIRTEHHIDLANKKYLSREDVQTLEFSAVQKAQENLATVAGEERPSDYHFVGYSVVEYRLDDIFLADLIGQRGKKMEVEMIVTFLPRIVVDSLLSVINRVGLSVDYLTLEPIAASLLVIPPEMYNFNLALIDIGAGTADIAVTRSGSIIGYAMVPFAGDEITEAIAENYLIDYQSAESIKRSLLDEAELSCKNVLGMEVKISSKEGLQAIEPQVEKLSELIKEEIIKINQKTPQAIICIGGGSLTPELQNKLANVLELPEARVGIRDATDLKNISGNIAGVNGTQTLTPLGIAVSYHQSEQQAVFMEVVVNGEQQQLFSLTRPTISDALLAAEVDIKLLSPRPGRGITYTINDELKSIKGSLGQPGIIKLNGEEADLQARINTGDEIDFIPAESGEDAKVLIRDVLPGKMQQSFQLRVDGNPIELKTKIYQNGNLVNPEQKLKDGAEIRCRPLETIREGVADLLEISPENLVCTRKSYTFNGQQKHFYMGNYLVKNKNEPIDLDSKLKDQLSLKIEKISNEPPCLTDICEPGTAEEIRFFFNNSELKLPAAGNKIICNGEVVNFDYRIKAGDEIKFQKKKLTINRVLKLINYNLSDSLKEEVRILINDKESSFSDKINAGDKLKILFNKKSTSSKEQVEFLNKYQK